MEKIVSLFTFIVYRKKSPNLYAKKFDWLLVNNDPIVKEDIGLAYVIEKYNIRGVLVMII